MTSSGVLNKIMYSEVKSDKIVIISMSYMYLKVGTTHFYSLALYNLVLGLMDILLKSKLFKWWMSHGDMTDMVMAPS